jgi:branched-chain amino acid transport system permease protein
MLDLLYTLVQGLLLGGIYALVALGLNLIFGVMSIINIAHGTFLMLGAYTSYWAYSMSSHMINPIMSIPISLLIGFAFGMLIYQLLVKYIVKAGELMSLLMMYGVSILIMNLAQQVWTPKYRGISYTIAPVRLGSFTIPSTYLIAGLFALAMVCVLYLFLSRTYLGRAVRSIAQNRDSAYLMGVNVNLTSMVVFGLGVSVAFVSGTIITLISPAIYPHMGGHWTMLSFCVAVLGGLGNERGALLGGIIMGVITTFATRYILSPTLAPMLAFLILIFILLYKPTGLLGIRKS